MCYIQVKNIRLNSFYEEKKIKLCLTKQLLNMFKLWCEWGIRLSMKFEVAQGEPTLLVPQSINSIKNPITKREARIQTH